MTKWERRWKLCVYLGVPLVLVAVVLTGLGLLSVQNLSSNVTARQFINDHATAIRNLFIRN